MRDKSPVHYFQGYLETFNLETGFTRDEYCFVDVGHVYVNIRLEEFPG